MAIDTREQARGDAFSPPRPRSFLAPWLRHPRRWAANPSFLAVAVWLVTLPIAALLPRLADADPFGNEAWATALAAGFVCVVLVLALALWRGTNPALAGVSAGLMATWVALTLRLVLQATPFGFGGLLGDAGRQTATATRYSVTAAPADAWIPGLPAEYPPLYFWLTGRAAAILDTPAWQLIGEAEVLTMSGAVIAGFLLWRRLISPWLALVVVGLTLVTFGDPRKPYEVVVAVAFLPWVIATFARPPAGRLRWLPAGLIGGLIVMTYQAWLVFGALGILAIIAITWRRAADRRRYLLHLVGVGVVAAAAAAWYVVPFLWATLTRETTATSDLYGPGSLLQNMFPFLAVTPLGVLQLVGLGGLLWLRRSAWWATPLLLLAASAYLYRIVATVRYSINGHTAFLHYTSNLYAVALVAAGVLVIAHAVPRIAQRIQTPPARGAVAGALAVVLSWTGYAYGQQWMPVAEQPSSHYSAEAHTEPLPGGGYPRYAPVADRSEWFPVDQISEFVERTTGPDPHRVTLTVDDRLYAYLPWPGYMSTSRMAAGSLMLWDRRRAELARLTTITDPAGFTAASADTEFGPIDIFILYRAGGAWVWDDLRFSPTQFDRAAWAVADDLPSDIVVAVRR